MRNYHVRSHANEPSYNPVFAFCWLAELSWFIMSVEPLKRIIAFYSAPNHVLLRTLNWFSQSIGPAITLDKVLSNYLSLQSMCFPWHQIPLNPGAHACGYPVHNVPRASTWQRTSNMTGLLPPRHSKIKGSHSKQNSSLERIIIKTH